MANASRITLLNPHADDLIKTPVSFWLVRRRGLEKYGYLIDEPARRGQRVAVLIDGTLSALFGQKLFARLPGWLRRMLLMFEIMAWIRINDLADKVTVYWSASQIADRAFLYIFSYKNCVGAFGARKETIEQFATKLINLSHYFILTTEKARNISSLKNAVLIGESDLRRNPYFQRHFPSAGPLLVVPFAVNKRFFVKKRLEERTQICAATGSFHNLHEERPHGYYKDYIDFFGTDTYHPVRKLLYRRRDELGTWFSNRISLLHEMRGRSDVMARIANHFSLDVAQTEYFSFDIVDFYNDHKFAVVGEEMSGSPAIGFFEAMACGCAMLGQEGLFYEGIGLQPGVHYLTHDGSVESIKGAIDCALATPGELERISLGGRSYATEHCTPAAVWDTLERKLASLSAP